MNRGASYLVTPHNLSFNKRAIKAAGTNHDKVVGSIQSMIDKHEFKQAKRMRGMTEEMAKKARAQKPANIIRTQRVLDELNRNSPGQQINGRRMTQPDTSLYQKMLKKQRDLERRNRGSRLSNTSGDNQGGGASSKIKVMNFDDEEKNEIVRDFTHSILLRSGSTGGNKNLFVNSKEAFMQLPKAKSPMGMTT